MKNNDLEIYSPIIVWFASWFRREERRQWQLRDTLAMEILRRRLDSTSLLNWNCGQTNEQNMERFARHADFLTETSYVIADSMLRARLKDLGGDSES